MHIVEDIVRILKKYELTISTAESCTGGMIASELVAVSGVSDCYQQGFITYANAAKESLIGVLHETLETHGAVSAPCAREMAQFVRKKANASIGLATTGIAGPSGGSEHKPVGLVYISCAISNHIVTRKYIFKGPRNIIRHQAMWMSFILLRDCLRKEGYL